jgi:hypothetical protein
MSRRLFVHIGLPKTGSTSIQAFLARNREILLTRSIDYLTIGEYQEGIGGKISSGNGAYVARSMFPATGSAFVRWENPAVGQAFVEAVQRSEARDLLLSSEFFAFATAEQWKRLNDLCGELQLKLHLIACARNQCDWLSSGYLQGVKRQHVVLDPTKYIAQQYKTIALLKYDSYFSAIAKEVENRIVFVSYDLASKSNSLLRNFMSTLGVHDLKGFSDTTIYLNPTPRPEEIAFLRECNLYGPSGTFSDILAQADSVSAPGRTVAPWTVISPDLAAQITDYFSESVARFLASFRLGPDFFQAPCNNFIDVTRLKIEIPELVSIVARYLVAMDRRVNALENRPKDE